MYGTHRMFWNDNQILYFSLNKFYFEKRMLEIIFSLFTYFLMHILFPRCDFNLLIFKVTNVK